MALRKFWPKIDLEKPHFVGLLILYHRGYITNAEHLLTRAYTVAAETFKNISAASPREPVSRDATFTAPKLA
jgi:hypothetical protein